MTAEKLAEALARELVALDANPPKTQAGAAAALVEISERLLRFIEFHQSLEGQSRPLPGLGG